MDRPMRVTDVFKRLLLGRPLASARLEHERLGNPTALAVFASDNLSSSAYATEEILRVLVPVVGVAAFGLVVPVSLAVLGVLAILLFSYRQTIRAYPTAAGAYIVTKDNFGLLPAQVAGVALLTDYILTVAVSVSAGVQALSSLVPAAHGSRVPIAVGFIWLITWGNLRGVRESGRMFALPTYVFIVSVLVLLATGLVRALGGDLHQVSATSEHLTASGGTAAGAGLILVLRAFASGGAAVTGVEAISDGVPAFRKPEWRNATKTLMWMGAILGTLFLGLSLLASKLQVVPVEDESKSVVAQIAQAVFGSSTGGRAMFVTLQIATMLILVVAANTSFADFPRLAFFQASDEFLPRQFRQRGHRLVFSTGILALAITSSVLVIALGASVTALIPLYAIGVFTSFTLSQAGMARRHRRLREPRWRVGLFINGLGALATGVVAIVVAVVKFWRGAWLIIALVPILVALFLRMNRQYAAEERELTEGLGLAEDAPPARLRVAVLVDRTDSKTLHAVQYALTVAPRNLDLLHVSTEAETTGRLLEAWRGLGLRRELRVLSAPAGPLAAIRAYASETLTSEDALTIVVPGPARLSTWERLRHGRTGDDVREAVSGLSSTIVTVVRDHGGGGHPLLGDDRRIRLVPRARHVVALFIDRVDRSTVQALAYASALDPDGVRAYHVGVDPQRAAALLEAWPRVASRTGVPLEAVHCPDRNVARMALEIVVGLEAEDTEVSVVLPRRTYPSRWHRLLHDRTGRTIARALAGRPHVDVVTIPYRLGHAADVARSDGVPPPPNRAALTGRRL